MNSIFREIQIDIPTKTRNNGTLYLHAIVVPSKYINKNDLALNNAIRLQDVSILSMRLTRYSIPQYQAFNLLTEQGENMKHTPITHIKKKITIIMLTEKLSLQRDDMPYEFIRLLRLNHLGQFLPIIQQDFLQTQTNDLEPVESTTFNKTVLIKYNPCSPGWLRFIMQVENALGQLLKMGFTVKDLDEVKRVFSETNVYLLCATMLIGSVHVSIAIISVDRFTK